MSTLRFGLLQEALGRKAVPVSSENRPADDFGKYVFNREKMQRYLSKYTYTTLTDLIDKSLPLSGYSAWDPSSPAFIKEISVHIDFITEKTADMIEARKKAITYHDTIVPLTEDIRYHIDKLELIVDDGMWTLPTYRELLFVR